MLRTALLVTGFIIGAVTVGCTSSSSSAPTPSISAVHWELNEAPSGAQLRITGYIGSSSCDSFDLIEVQESDSAVDVQVLVKSNGNAGCTADMRMQAITVDLDEPLGVRELTGCAPFEIEPGVVDPEGCRRIVPRMS